VIAVSPGVILAIVPLALTYSHIQARYVATSRELKRLDSLAMSPIFGHFSESLQGLTSLRAFRVQPRVLTRNGVLLDESNRAYWPAQCVNRWLSVRLELLGISVVFGTAAFVSSLLPTSAGLAGLALTSALNLTGLMNWMVRQTTELEVSYVYSILDGFNGLLVTNIPFQVSVL
jgi:ABC-type multidrug transport system fused ATPase/permease subunit